MAELRIDPEGKLKADAKLIETTQADKQALSQMWNSLQEIEQVTEATGGSDALDLEKARLLQQLKGPSGKLIESPLNRAHRNIATQLRSFVRRIKKSMPRLAEHLDQYLNRDFPNFGYFPPSPSPTWQI